MRGVECVNGVEVRGGGIDSGACEVNCEYTF